MADAKNVKDDPLVLAKSIMKHRGSRDSAKVNIFFFLYIPAYARHDNPLLNTNHT